VKEVHGVTLSSAQHEEITRRKIPGVTAHCMDFFAYEPTTKYDALTSICMIEHVVSPEEARAGKSVDRYRSYFKRAHEITNKGSWFGLQTILRNFVPRNRDDVRDIGWVTYEIFPGGITPRMEDIVQAVNPYWEIMEMKTRREHYGKTCWHWRDRMRKNEALIRQKFGDQVFDDYDRYLSTCVRGFEKHYQSLAQWSLRRID
jgi:cyclopropane-fatty-acyl-phospholipid synthase